MARQGSASGIILGKRDLLKNDRLVIVFCEELGKIALFAKGINTITSRRISHLETGNYIKFSYYFKDPYYYLQETELVYGYSKIRSDPLKVNHLYTVLYTVNQVMPENSAEQHSYALTMKQLKELNNNDDYSQIDLRIFMKSLLQIGGYITKEQETDEEVDPMKVMEELTGKKVIIPGI